MSQIKFKKQCTAMGRNGTSKQIGLDIYPGSRIDTLNNPFDMIVLTPVNSYGQLTNGWLEIPVENVPELIEQLQYFYDYIRKNQKV